MKKSKNPNAIIKIFKGIALLFDRLLITPISRFVYFLRDRLSSNKGIIDRLLNKPTVLVYISLLLAFTTFVVIDKELITLDTTKSLVLSNIEVNSEYNEEAYVIEGIPEKAEISLRGRTGELYLARQLGDHRVSMDLSDLGPGTHKVNLEYNNPVKNLSYILSPSSVTVVVYPKISEVRTISTDVINTDKLNETLIISNVLLDRDEIIVKSYKEKLSTIANVKAIVDVNQLNSNGAGTYTVENVKLVAYDDNGKEITGIEVVPSTVTATVTITSPSKVVPVKVMPTGTVKSGSAISSINSSVKEVTVYADDNVLSNINYIEVEVDVSNLSETKTYQKVINKPTGVRSISETSVSITVSMEEETSKEFENITVVTEGLRDDLKAGALSINDAKVTVSVKGVQSLLDNLDASTIKAYVDLSNISEPGTYSVPVNITGDDVRFTYTSKTNTIQIVVTSA